MPVDETTIVDEYDAAFDEFIGDTSHYVPEDQKVQMALKRNALAKARNTLYALREDYRACSVAGDKAAGDGIKTQIKGWMRAVDEKEREVRDLSWEICRGEHSWAQLLDGQPRLCQRCQDEEPSPPVLV